MLRNCYRGIGALLTCCGRGHPPLCREHAPTRMRRVRSCVIRGEFILAWSPTHVRIAGSAYLGALALIVAHATNAFVADALYVPLNQLSPSPSAPELISASNSATAQQSVDAILQSGLFEIPQAPSLNEGSLAAGPPPSPIEAARKVTLLGTAFGRSGGLLAVLEDVASKKQQLYRLGTQVENIGTLAAIEKNRVLFRKGTQEEWLALAFADHARSGAPASGSPQLTPYPEGPSRRTLDRREIETALADPTRLLTHAQAVPNLTNGKLDGFRLNNVVPLGFFDKIGLRSNDLLLRINGVDLRDPSVAMNLFQQLRSERLVRVDLVRNTQPKTLTYEIR